MRHQSNHNIKSNIPITFPLYTVAPQLIPLPVLTEYCDVTAKIMSCVGISKLVGKCYVTTMMDTGTLDIGGQWLPMVDNGYQWWTMVINGGQWLPMVASGICVVLPMVTNGYQWSPMARTDQRSQVIRKSIYSPRSVHRNQVVLPGKLLHPLLSPRTQNLGKAQYLT
jgi:hypothetical protein